MAMSSARMFLKTGLFLLATTTSLFRVHAASIEDCPGYKVSNFQHQKGKITADLSLAGDACNIYGADQHNLRLLVEYQTQQRLHVKIYDAEERAYQVPESVIPPPTSESTVDSGDMVFHLSENPFSFSVIRKSTGETLFDTSGSALVFEDQYLRLRTNLPMNPNLYGLGENSDSLRLPISNYSHTFWNAGESYIPTLANLYGTHNIYYDHRGKNGTHAVFLLNSNGMKVNIDNSGSTGQYLEYNSLGGVFDFYFISGSTPKDTSSQYAELIGYSAMMPYWGFGYHQCRYGMQDIWEVAGVVANYSAANIPLETMWTDIDYMDYRRTLSLDPMRFSLSTMRQMVDTLHSRQQKYIVMVDPAVAQYPYPPFEQGVAANAFLKLQNESLYTGVVWAGPSAFPDWFNENTQGYWNQQFAEFLNAEKGVDIDGLWIDMNEASNFCDYPCPDPALYSVQSQDPPRPPVARMHSPYAIPGFPSNFQPQCVTYVTFNVYAEVDNTVDQLLIMGDAFGLGENVPHDAPEMFPYTTNPPVWNLTVQLPAHTNITYQYPLYEYSIDGSYILEKQNRSIRTGGCNTMWYPQEVHDNMTTSQDSTTRRKVLATSDLSPRVTDLQARQRPPADSPGSMQGFPNRNLTYPPYDIGNYWGDLLSSQTIPTNLYHSNGLAELDVHNLFGTMMSSASREAMIARRPGLRPLIITRSTFARDGKHVGHWFGDNISTWLDYRTSIRQMIEFAALFQFPMVGSDICGFNGNTTIHLCSRWAMLGAFYPFYRNHKVQGALPQEYYRWPLVAEAGRKAINTRYQLLDYLYTAMYQQNQTGSPTINPLFFIYPEDSNTYALEEQFFFGNSILVSPVLEDNTTSVTAYMPNDLFYDFETLQSLRGQGKDITFHDVSYTQIPAHIRGGSIIPMRINSANTTTELRKQNFKILVAPGLDGTAAGSLYLDDGESLVKPAITNINFGYAKNGEFTMNGTFAYNPEVYIGSIVLLGVNGNSGYNNPGVSYNSTSKTLTRQVNLSLQKSVQMNLLGR